MFSIGLISVDIVGNDEFIRQIPLRLIEDEDGMSVARHAAIFQQDGYNTMASQEPPLLPHFGQIAPNI